MITEPTSPPSGLASPSCSPSSIYLQWNGDEEPSDEPVCITEVTWHWENIFPHDVKYLRADLVEAKISELTRIARDYIEDLDDSGDEAKAKDYRRWLNRIIEENAVTREPRAPARQNQSP